MNWEDYLDPYLNKQEYWSNAPASEPTIRMPRQSDYPVDTLRAPDRTLGDWFGDLFFPETREYVATGQGKPGMVGEWADSIGGKIGSLAKMGFAASKGIPALAGMVEIGGKKYPQAFLHRSMGLGELGYLGEHLNNNVQSLMPMTAVAPKYRYTFAPDQYQEGVLFNAHQGDINRIWPFDAMTTDYPVKRIGETDLFTKNWRSDYDQTAFRQKNTDIIDFWKEVISSDQLNRENILGEILGSYGPRNIAGVRISPTSKKERAQAFLDFAQRHNLPTYYFSSPANPSLEDVIKSTNKIEDSGMGTWRQDKRGFYIPGR